MVHIEQIELVEANSCSVQAGAHARVEAMLRALHGKGLESPIPGLPNLGNTCFMNAVLQCLLNTPGEFLEALTAFVGPRPAGLTHKAFLGSCFAKLVEEYGLKDTTPDSSFSERFGSSFFGRVQGALPSDSTALKGLKSAMAEIDPRYGGCQQQDAYEFLGTLLEGLDENLGALFSAQFMQLTSPSDSAIRSVCGIETYVTRKCHCCGEVFTVDRSIDTAIRLPLLSEAAQMDEAQRLKEQSQPIQLQQLLLDMQMPEDIEGYDCDKCREHAKIAGCEHVRSKVTQQCGLIGDSQDILVFALYRFLNVLDKNGKFCAVKVKRQVKIPTLLALPTGKYQLYGVVSHKGENLNHGHYISAVRSLRDDQWYDCDDSVVKPIALRHLYENSEITATRPNADPFILFYHRIEGGASSASSQPVPNENPTATSAPSISSSVLSHSQLPQLPTSHSFDDCEGEEASPMTCEDGHVSSMNRENLTSITHSLNDCEEEKSPMTCEDGHVSSMNRENLTSITHSLNDCEGEEVSPMTCEDGDVSSMNREYLTSITHSLNDCEGRDVSPMTCEDGDVSLSTCQPAANDNPAENDNRIADYGIDGNADPLVERKSSDPDLDQWVMVESVGRCSSHVTSYVSPLTHQPEFSLFLSLDASQVPDTTLHSLHDFLKDVVYEWQ